MFGKHFKEITREAKKWIVLAAVCGIFFSCANIALAYLVGVAVDQAVGGKIVIGTFLTTFAILVIFRALVWGLATWFSQKATFNVRLGARDRIYKHLLKLGPSYSGDERTGKLVSTAVEGVEALEAYFGLYLPQLFVGLLLPILVCGFIATIDWVTALVLFICLPLTPIVVGAVQGNFRKVSKRYFAVTEELSAEFLDSLQGLPTLKMFNLGKAQGEKIRVKSEKLRKETMGLLAVNQIMLFLVDWLFGMATTVVAFVMSVWRIQAGALTLGEGVAIVILSIELARPLNLIGTFFFAGALGRASVKKIDDFLDIKPAIESSSSEKPLIESPKVEFIDVDFAYDEESGNVLDGLSFEIKPNESVAIMGPSGAGKTSIVRLLVRFFEQQKGEVRIGGHDIREMDIEWLRAHIALVSQATYLFYGTVAENLRIAKADAALEELEAATKAANIYDHIVSLPEGFETLIGERGTSISGGQAQRLAIARAILKDAPIVVLDEATSNVDSENEEEIQEALDRLMKDKTVLVIAHRLSTVRQSDRIVVLQEGTLKEEGTHDELIAKGGVYAHVTKQKTFEIAGGAA